MWDPLGESTVPLEGCGKSMEDMQSLLKDVRPSQEDERFLLNKPRHKLRHPTRKTRSTNTGFPKKNGNPPSSPPSSRVSKLDVACIPSKPDALNESDPKSEPDPESEPDSKGETEPFQISDFYHAVGAANYKKASTDIKNLIPSNILE